MIHSFEYWFFVCRPQQTSVDAVAGGLASNFFQFLAEEQGRIETIDRLQAGADLAIEDRLKREAAEMGRRQKEGLVMRNANA